jgi:hypothetical protein
MVEKLLLGSTLAFAICGMAWLALAMDAHWRQLHVDKPLTEATAQRLRISGAVALLISLGCCSAAEHASMAALVWIMSLTAAALLVTFTLAYRPRWLGFLAR